MSTTTALGPYGQTVSNDQHGEYTITWADDSGTFAGRLYWRDRQAQWYLDIEELASGTNVEGLRVALGWVGIGCEVMLNGERFATMVLNGEPTEVDIDSLGVDSVLVALDSDALEDIDDFKQPNAMRWSISV